MISTNGRSSSSDSQTSDYESLQSASGMFHTFSVLEKKDAWYPTLTYPDYINWNYIIYSVIFVALVLQKLREE